MSNKQIKEKIGLTGAGNMGSAILEGLLKKGIAGAGQVWIYDKIADKAAGLAGQWKGCRQADSIGQLIQKTTVILLAVKPQDLKDCLSRAKGLTPDHLLISILAGTPVQKIRNLVPEQVKVVRAMPNLGATVGQSMTAVTGSDEGALQTAETFFSGCGRTVRLKEDFFDLVTALSGSGPAYFFYLMELLAQKGVEEGLTEEDARLLAVQTAAGSALLALASGDSPKELKDKVTSKGGTTEAALKVLKEHHVGEYFLKAFEAALQRGRQLSQS